MTNQDISACRLCASPTSSVFTLTVLGKHEVQYYECLGCMSLQTEDPYWLEDAYGDKNLSREDTGAAQRNIQNLAACFAVTKLLGLRNVIDFGGGDGLLCRLLRDSGVNCFVSDKYASPTYAQGFTEPDFDVPDLLMAFEVLEHFESPASDLHELFKYRPKALLFSTCLYKQQKKDWWYLSASSGQHIFFYSRRALEDIAKSYDYALMINGDYVLFILGEPGAKGWIAKAALSPLALRLFRVIAALLPSPGIQRDHLLQVEKSRRERQAKLLDGP